MNTLRTALDYNKLWAVAFTILILVVINYLGLDLPTVVEAAAVLFAVERTPNGRVPLRSETR